MPPVVLVGIVLPFLAGLLHPGEFIGTRGAGEPAGDGPYPRGTLAPAAGTEAWGDRLMVGWPLCHRVALRCLRLRSRTHTGHSALVPSYGGWPLRHCFCVTMAAFVSDTFSGDTGAQSAFL